MEGRAVFASFNCFVLIVIDAATSTVEIATPLMCAAIDFT